MNFTAGRSVACVDRAGNGIYSIYVSNYGGPSRLYTIQKNKIIESIPLNRMGSEQDIAEAVKFLAHSEYITGQVIKVDGGRSL